MGKNQSKSNSEEIIIAQDYQLSKQLSTSTSTEIWQATNLKTNEQFAIKFEKSSSEHQSLKTEYQIYSELNSGSDSSDLSIPKVHLYGTENNNNFMISDLLGLSLEDTLKKCGGKFTLKTVLMLADQILERLEWLHSKSFIHRHIHPGMFVTGLNENNQKIYMVNFCHASKYLDEEGEYVQFQDAITNIGVPCYSSLSTDLGIQPSRKDDLESIGYMLVQFLKGSLPWTNSSPKEMTDQKIMIPIEDLCKGFPEEFENFLQHCRNLKFDDLPDYCKLRAMFKNLYKTKGYGDVYDYLEFDWIAN